MIADLQQQIASIGERLNAMGGIFEIPTREKRLSEIDTLLARPEIWKDTGRTRDLQSEKARMTAILTQWQAVSTLWDDLQVFLDLAKEDEQEVASDIEGTVKALERHIHDIEKAHVLAGRDDAKGAFIEIHAGAGGLEAQDWAEMLLRMYLRWAEMNGYTCRIIDISSDEEAGIKHATVEVSGQWAFGYLKGETGVHRLVRISPYDANKRRHTSFASVLATPEVDQNIDISIDEKDLRIDTYRASGHGGQHVNKTDSAVRITHIPTGTVVQCQNERSQHKNKAFAMKLLASKLYELEEMKQKERLNEFSKGKKEIAWGSQIRSYVLQPYQLVKDHRTNLEVGNVNAVLDGGITPFIDSYLMFAASGKEGADAGPH
ncbi:MAG TPA: peptide chain release factor 2 [Desulfomonilia bacterium]|nr:peptide chain release factor 2 [Thermodesulfobacteriota bacterium]HWR68587.1 peptide chain release factor 2 [Desulfomonilia bacterium]